MLIIILSIIRLLVKVVIILMYQSSRARPMALGSSSNPHGGPLADGTLPDGLKTSGPVPSADNKVPFWRCVGLWLALVLVISHALCEKDTPN